MKWIMANLTGERNKLMSDEGKLKQLQDDQKRLAVLSMEVDFRYEMGGDVRFAVNDAYFIIQLAHEAIKNHNIQMQKQD